MQNRTFVSFPNGKILCIHKWEPNGFVGPDWDVSLYATVPVICSKCGRLSRKSSNRFSAWPDELINTSITYY
jgi:hypothetical protein